MLASNLHLGIAAAVQAPRQGRVVYLSLVVRDAPAFAGKRVKSYRRDTILQITGQLLGGVDGDYNRTWYRLGSEGYVYSGGVQPVDTILNGVVTDIPAAGVLGEITVPYAEFSLVD